MLENLDDFFKTLQKYNISKEAFDKETKTLNVESLVLKKVDSLDLEYLSLIEIIDGDLIIDGTIVKVLDCFSNLTSVKKLSIINSNRLESIVGFNSLSSLTSLIITDNTQLNKVFGFNKLFFSSPNIKGVIKIINNTSLKSIAFLRGLKSVNSSFYLHNNILENLEGLEKLEKVNASFSLSSNNLKNLKELNSLKHVDGMLGLINNQLESLDGIENLEHLKTVKWNNKLRTITLSGNDNLKDIKALSNIVESSNSCVVIVDSTQEFLHKPDQDSLFSNNNIIVKTVNETEILEKSKVCKAAPNPKSRFIDIRDEFILDEHWRPGIKYYDYTYLRGREGYGVQLERISLVNWQDKIYIHHFLKQYNIPSMPIIFYSHRQEDDFFDKLKIMYENGLKSFVVKVSHLANSNGVYRIKDGKFIEANDIAIKDKMYGKDVDFEYLKTEINNRWLENQQEEDWSSMMVNPGVILEELIEDSVELKFSIVFGEVVGFFMRVEGFPTFDKDGKLISTNEGVLPHWWKEGKELALKVAKLVKADHIRIDVFYYNNQAIINEITWNGGERSEYTSMVSKKLNEGYAKRLKLLGKKSVDVKNDPYVERVLSKEEYLLLAKQSNLDENTILTQCKFIITGVDKTQPKLYWMNTKKYENYYEFYKNVLKNDIDKKEFESISLGDKSRKNIVGTLVYHEKGIQIDGKEFNYGIYFLPTDSISLSYIKLVFSMIYHRAMVVKETLFLNIFDELDFEIISKNINFKNDLQDDIKSKNSDIPIYLVEKDFKNSLENYLKGSI